MADPIMMPISGTKFQLDKTIVSPEGSLTVEIGASADHDVITAILDEKPFPDRANGKIELGSIALKGDTGKNFVFDADQTTIGFQASAEFKRGLGVFNSAADVIASLQLRDGSEIDLNLGGDDSEKFLVLLSSYDIQGSFSGSHPIGVVGSLGFGATGDHDLRYAVVHRFPSTTRARTALEDLFASWRLPRHVRTSRDLKPGSWLIAEVDGSLALTITAQLGYDLNMVREAKLLGMTRNLGAKIDAALKATFGFNASGNYLLVLGRESDKDESNTIRLQLFKQSRKGLSFGLNLSVGVIGQNQLPADVDDLVKAIFGVHGSQVIRDLHLIEQWADQKADLFGTAARLLNETGLNLLTQATGIDAATEFDKARQIVMDEFEKWDALPAKVAAATWGILSKLDGGGDSFKTLLKALADSNPQTKADAFARSLQDATFGDAAAGQWLASVADQGLLVLSSQLDHVQPIAAQTLDILNGGIIKRIQNFIEDRLNLNQIRTALTQDDFNKIDSWLIGRLGDFFDKELHFEDLKPIQNAITLVLKKAKDICSRAIQALNNRYNFEFAAAYAKNTQLTALLDVNFDLKQSNDTVGDIFHQVVTGSRLDNLLLESVEGITLNLATLTHEITRTGSVQLHMPMFSFASQHFNDSLAKINAEEDGGRVLVYELDARDSVTVKNRYISDLSVFASLELKNGQLVMTPDSNQSIAYQSRQVKKGMTLVDFEHRVTPFVNEYLHQLFSRNESSLETFYADLDRTVENVLHNGANEFGDVVLATQVAVPNSALASWFIRRDRIRLKRDSMAMSRALQRKLRQLLPSCFFQDVSRLRSNASVAALLVWAALPVSTSIELLDGTITLDSDKDVYWDFADANLRRAMAMASDTTANLVPALQTAQARLREAGDDHNASFFIPQQAATFQRMTLDGIGDTLFNSLLITEAEIIRGATAALRDVNGMLDVVATKPTKAIGRFADFGADLTDAFHNQLSSVYGNDALRTLSSMVLVEASRAIDPDLGSQTPKAMLIIMTLRNGHQFQLSDFVAGVMPPRDQVAIAQTLVNLSS
jgi:hypothetical protein